MPRVAGTINVAWKSKFLYRNLQLPSFSPTPLHRHFWLFGVLNLPLNKEISKVHVCVLPYYLTLSCLCFTMCKLLIPLIVPVVFSLTKGPTGHLGTIFWKLMVSDGRGLRSQKAKITRKCELTFKATQPCSGSFSAIFTHSLLQGLNPDWKIILD